MKVNIENLRQSVMMPTKEDRADWTNGNKCYSYRVRAVAAFTLFMSIKEKMNRGQQI